MLNNIGEYMMMIPVSQVIANFLDWIKVDC